MGDRERMDPMSEVATTARQRVDRIKIAVEGAWQLIVESYRARDWESLGYATWDEMCTREFGTSRLRLPREERAETVQSLREAGLSLRAISAATGTSVNTVRKAAQVYQIDTPARGASGMDEFAVDTTTGEVLDDPWENGSPQAAEFLGEPQPVVPPKITGIDGKTYTPPVKRAPYRKPLPDVARDAGYELRKAMERIERIVSDDRYQQNEKQVALALRGHLLYVADTVAAVIDQLP